MGRVTLIDRNVSTDVGSVLEWGRVGGLIWTGTSTGVHAATQRRTHSRVSSEIVYVVEKIKHTVGYATQIGNWRV